MCIPRTIVPRTCLVIVVCLFASTRVMADTNLMGDIFGTSYHVVLRDAESFDKSDISATIQSRLEAIDALMSTYRIDSEVSQFNLSEPGDWFSVSSETAQLVDRAQAISKQTEGAFDITVGPAVALWNFGVDAKTQFVVPTEEEINATLSRVGYDKLEVRLDPPAIRKSTAGLKIDLSAVAKGYAVDAVCETLADIDHYMVEIGGEVRVRGTRRDGSPWRIGLEAPTKDAREVDSIVTLQNEAMATSGDYRNFHEQDGVTYSHTIDPKTARPVSHQLGSVTIVADDCATADALATALLVMGPGRGKEWAEVNAVKALLVSRNGDQLVRATTPGFPQLNVQPSKADQQSEANNSYIGMFVATAVIFGLAVLAMSIGTIVANRRLQGSCGGMAGLKDAGGNTICDMCTKPSTECSGEPQEESVTTG